ncbi:hypothetical protein B0H94_10517 [Salsuginibacillus halophilus]|uniref:Uncharacterized protein n=1 Tax=Salsuginibacillus halophilus TaxID=517424 RepID=A0A2P8HKX2_9BACI|nr:hypothetical protein [Salsuginibacillus halophilus]PSL46867.1 hypothetical protein B0H94_10517 [Salsuginibacillus halophilus]
MNQQDLLEYISARLEFLEAMESIDTTGEYVYLGERLALREILAYLEQETSQ